MIELNNKKKLVLAISIYCSLVLSIIVIGQFDKISDFFNSIFTVISPIVIGFAMAYLLNPILKFFEKKVFKSIKNKKILRTVGIICTYLALASFILIICMLVIPQVTKSLTDLSSQFDSYKNTLLAQVDLLLQKLKDMDFIPEDVDASVVIKYVSNSFSSGSTIIKNILSYLTNNIQSILIIPKNILLGFFISLYALSTKERLGAQAKKLLRAVLSDEMYSNAYNRIRFTHSTFGGYFTGVVIDAIFVGVVTFIALLIFNVPYASLISVIVAITNVIPIFGPFLGSIPSALIIFISNPEKVIPFIILILIIQQIDGNIVAPKILGNSTGMSSLAVIIAITIMGSCFNFIGMIIGVPVFALIIALIKELIEERLRVKELPIETSNYYPRNSIVDATNESVPLTEKLHNKTKAIIKKILKKNKKENKE